jgi:hypothetical protein
MNILVLNAGSGSHKCSLFRVENALPVEPLEPIWEAVIMATDPGSTAQEPSLTIECEGRKKESKTLPANLSSRKRVEYRWPPPLEGKASIPRWALRPWTESPCARAPEHSIRVSDGESDWGWAWSQSSACWTSLPRRRRLGWR